LQAYFNRFIVILEDIFSAIWS